MQVDGELVGYGSVWIGPYWMPKGSVFEFYVLPAHRTSLFPLFQAFLNAVRPCRIYAQTNDPFLGILIYDYVEKIIAGHVLFREGKITRHTLDHLVFRQATPNDKERIFPHKVEPVGDWLIETEDRIVATGGIGYHYNRPYGDIFMEVDEPFRWRGIGSFLVQELKRVCRESGSVPAARCRPGNVASRSTLERAGFVPCGRLIYGDMK